MKRKEPQDIKKLINVMVKMWGAKRTIEVMERIGISMSDAEKDYAKHIEDEIMGRQIK